MSDGDGQQRKTALRTLLTVAYVVLSVSACERPLSQEPAVWTVLYAEDFSRGPNGWRTDVMSIGAKELEARAFACRRWYGVWYGREHAELDTFACEKYLDVNDGVAESHSPWWLDRNHESPGAGLLHLLATLDFTDTVRPTDRLSKAVKNRNGEPTDSFDLRGVRLRARLMLDSASVGPNAGVVFWFESFDPVSGIRSNYILNRPLVIPARGVAPLHEVDVVLTANPAAWTCLVSNDRRTDFYGCGGLVRAMANVNSSFGFLLFPVPLENLQEGRFRLGWIELSATR